MRLGAGNCSPRFSLLDPPIVDLVKCRPVLDFREDAHSEGGSPSKQYHTEQKKEMLRGL